MSTALVLGGAACVWSDVEAALNLGEFDGVIGCNDIGIVWPGAMDAWVSLHSMNFPAWSARRGREGRPPHRHIIGHAEAGPTAPVDLRTEYRFPGQDRSGSSGLFALKVALVDLGFDKAVLCGVPMDARPHFFDGKAWDACADHRKGWEQARPAILDRARSMSGWTAKLLGTPDTIWLAA